MHQIYSAIEWVRYAVSHRWAAVTDWLADHRAVPAVMALVLVLAVGVGAARLWMGAVAEQPARSAAPVAPAPPPSCADLLAGIRQFMDDTAQGGRIAPDDSRRLDQHLKRARATCSEEVLDPFVRAEVEPWTTAKARPGTGPG